MPRNLVESLMADVDNHRQILARATSAGATMKERVFMTQNAVERLHSIIHQKSPFLSAKTFRETARAYALMQFAKTSGKVHLGDEKRTRAVNVLSGATDEAWNSPSARRARDVLRRLCFPDMCVRRWKPISGYFRDILASERDGAARQ